ncbi:uncharacterized protein LOC116031959 [Ipomoea triloba]|uniref:uncharacterized protein LOC116031959 n=1 Tax=Ipomoea triloba TaxID=35885 RepID=UPI00125DE9B7|nr:uncharacterized protein LOC116031959 [Ipomoea triloba]GLL30456.1 uncharacterized protein LOC109184524 [Ipomoea trifida]
MAMALSNSLVLSKSKPLHLSSGFCLKSVDQSVCPTTLSFNPRRARNSSVSGSSFVVQAKYSENDGGNSTAFVGGFILGGLIVGTLGCVFAPQISYALAGADRIDKKDLMKKLPKFIYDEEKALERQRKKLAEKIEQLNTAIDDISSQMKHGDSDEAVVNSEVGAEVGL